METRLTVYILSVALLVAASVGAIANQSGKFVGVHEIPPFVCDRVEFVPSLVDDRGTSAVGLSRGERSASANLVVPGSRDALCRDAGG